MSNYLRMTKHPLTGEWEEAAWIDNHFGPHHYGVFFPDGSKIDPEAVPLETKQ